MFPKLAAISSLSKKLLLLLIVGCSAMSLIKGIYALGQEDSQQSSDERKLKVREFKGMPVKLVAVRNLQSDTWYDDLEIELKNVSDKPIYFLTAYLVFPEEKVASGESAVRLSWGDPKKLDSNNVASPEADNIEPGKTFALVIPKMYVKGLRAKERLRPKSTRNLILRFQKTYFGDGTGYEVEDWFRDFRWKRASARVLHCPLVNEVHHVSYNLHHGILDKKADTSVDCRMRSRNFVREGLLN